MLALPAACHHNQPGALRRFGLLQRSVIALGYVEPLSLEAFYLNLSSCCPSGQTG